MYNCTFLAHCERPPSFSPFSAHVLPPSPSLLQYNMLSLFSLPLLPPPGCHCKKQEEESG